MSILQLNDWKGLYMKNYEIVIDSTCDLNASLREKFGIYHDYIRSVLYLPSGEETLVNLEVKESELEKFYIAIKKNVGAYKTAFATFLEFSRVVRPLLEKKIDVMVITISSGISGAVNAYRNYAEALKEEFPKANIEVVDTLKYSGGSGLLAVYASLNKRKGMSLEDNLSLINSYALKLHEMGVMDDLSFLAKNGRISASKAFFGSLAGMVPVADMTLDGKNEPLGVIKGAKNADKFSLEYLKEMIINSEEQIIFIVHSSRKERALKFKEALLKEVKVKDVYIIEVGESCAPNIGAGLCTYFFLGSELTKGREKEKALFTKIKESL